MMADRNKVFNCVEWDVDVGRVKIGGGGGDWTPTGKQITPTANAREKARGSGFDPLGPDSCECIHYDIVSFYPISVRPCH